MRTAMPTRAGRHAAGLAVRTLYFDAPAPTTAAPAAAHHGQRSLVAALGTGSDLDANGLYALSTICSKHIPAVNQEGSRSCVFRRGYGSTTVRCDPNGAAPCRYAALS